MKAFLRLCCFLFGFILLLTLCNTLLVQTDELSYLPMYELTHRDDIELAFVGSSVARNHFEPSIITEETGLTAFNVALPFMALQGSHAVSKLMFEHHNPKYVALVTEPYLFEGERESQQTQFRLMPFIRNPIDRLEYYISLARIDSRWLDRLFEPRVVGVESFDQLLKNIRIRIDPQPFFDSHRANVEAGHGAHYAGSGYMHPGTQISEEKRQQLGVGHGAQTPISPIPVYHQESILRYKAMCEAQGAQFMIVHFPYHPHMLISTSSYLNWSDALSQFCKEHDILLFDFALAKETLLPDLSAYYQNTEHMSVEGTHAFSRAFCEAFNRHLAGEDVSSLFYENADAYRAGVTRVTNTWVTQEGRVYTADSNHGTYVTPEYRFAARNREGVEISLRGYSEDPVWQGDMPEGYSLRVYARATGSEQTEVHYDYLEPNE